MTGTANFGVIAASDEPEHRLAFEIFVDRVCGFVGSYYVSLGGKVDALVFAGGIGERSVRLRHEVVYRVSCLGFEVDTRLNQQEIKTGVKRIGTGGTGPEVLVCVTDEQAEMATICSEFSALW